MKHATTFLLILFYAKLSFGQLPQRPNLWDEDSLRTGQWIVYYDSAYVKKVSTEDSAKQYCLMNFVKGKPKGKVTCYYLNGIKQWDGHLSSIDPDINEGLVTYYYPKGNILEIATYTKNVVNGEYLKYYENGAMAIKGQLYENHANGIWEYYHENGQIKIRGNYENDVRNGIWEYYFDNGQLETKGLVKNDANEGFWEVFYPNGQLSYSANYSNGQKHGEYISYFENGHLEQRGQFKNGKQNGFYQFYHENGQLSSEGLIVDGLYQEKWTFYFSNGKIESQRAYIDDVEYGDFTYYYDSGVKKAEGEVANEKWNGFTTHYYPNGVINQQGKNVEGLKQGPWIFQYDNGQLVTVKTYVNDTTDGLWERYFDNGQLNEKGILVKDSKEGYWEIFYSNGNYDNKSTFQKDRRHGYVEYFHENGILKSKGNYIDGAKTGKWVYYHSNGQLSSEGLYENGVSAGEWVYYYENGTLKKRGHEAEDLAEGKWIYYYENGQISQEGDYSSNKREGLWKYYHENGQIKYSGFTHEDIGYGIWTYFDSLGRKESEGAWKDDKKEGTWIYYDTLGQITKTGNYVKDQSQGEWQHYQNNKKHHVVQYDRNIELDFWTLSDSAKNVAKRHQLEPALLIAKEAKNYWKKKIGDYDVADYDYDRLLGFIYSYVGIYDKSLKYYEAAQIKIEKSKGINSKIYAFVLNDIANDYNSINENNKSITYALQSLQILKNLFGKQNNDYFTTLDNLCSTYIVNKQFDEAELLLNADLEYRKDSVPDQVNNIISDLDALAEVKYRRKQYQASIITYKKIIQYVDSIQLKNSIDKLNAIRFIAYNFDDNNQSDSAIYYYQKAIQEHKIQNATNSSIYVYNYIYLSKYYYGNSQPQLALQYADTAVAICEDNGLINFQIYVQSLLAKAMPEFELYHFQTAYDYYSRANKFALSQKGFDNIYLTQSYQGMAVCEAELFHSQPDKAISNYQKAIQLYQPSNQFEFQYFHSATLLGQYYLNNDRYSEAIAIFKQLKTYLSQLVDYPIYNKGNLLLDIGKVYKKLDQYDSALFNFDGAAEVYQFNLDVYALEYADVLSRKAMIYTEIENYKMAEQFILKALDLIEKKYGKFHIEYIHKLADLAYIYRTEGNYNNAIVTYKQVLEQKESTYGKSSSTYTNSQLSLIVAYKNNRDYDLAISLLADIKKNILSYSDMSNANYLLYLEHMGDILSYQQKFDEADPYFKELVKRSENINRANPMEHAYVLRETANFYKYNKKLDKALQYLIPAIQLVEKELGPNSAKYTYYTETLAEIYFTQGNYYQSLEIKKTNLPIYEKEFGKESSSYINSYLKYVQQLTITGQFAEAIDRYQEIAPLIDQVHGSISIDKADYFEAIGSTYRKWGKPDIALDYVNQSYIVLDSVVVHETYYYDINDLKAWCLLDLRQLDEAESLYQKNKDLALRNWGKTYAYYATLNNMSFIYLEKGDFEQTEKLLIEAEKMFESYAVVTNTDRANYEDNLASLYLAWGKLDKADVYWSHVIQLLFKNIKDNFAYMSESEKANYWDDYKDDFEFYNTFAIKAKDQIPRAIGDMYDNQLQTKSILLSASTKERSRIVNSGDSLLINQYFEYVDLKEKLVKIYGYTSEQLASEKINVDSLERLTNTLEGKLSLNAAALSQEEKAKKIKWQDIQKSLAKNEAAVEIIRFNYFDRHKTDSVIYAALILTQETKRYPELVILPNGKDLEGKYLKNYLSSIKYKSKDDYSYANFWKAIDEKIKGKSMIYFSPDGVYNQLNINTLQRENSTYILDAYRMQIMTSTRDVVLINKETKKAVDIRFASLFGFPQYDLDHASINEYVQERAMERSRSQERDIDLDRFGFSELPGTKTETESIENLLSENHWQTSLYLGHEALEEHLKSVQHPDVLHIATHGYFLEDTDQTTNKIQLGINTEKGKANPMLRSGLLLAGAAQTAMGNSSNQVENGIFTAYEAMNLNLNNTELVVLSACETGKGEVKSGEGVYGLQRAFQIAGTKALIMSLWKVSDEATQLLMTRFYSEWIKGKTKSEAFLSAQQQVRNQYKEPYYWGAFILLGE